MKKNVGNSYSPQVVSCVPHAQFCVNVADFFEPPSAFGVDPGLPGISFKRWMRSPGSLALR